MNRQSELVETTMMKIRNLEEERAALEAKYHKVESELSACEISRESLRRDKQHVSIYIFLFFFFCLILNYFQFANSKFFYY